MKILLVNRHYNNDHVPTGRMLRDLVGTLVKRGHEPFILSARSSYSQTATEKEALSEKVLFLWTLGEKRRLLSWLLFWVQACLIVPFLNWDSCVLLTDPPFLVFAAKTAAVFKRERRSVYWWTMDLYPESLVAHGVLKKGSLLERFFEWINRSSVRKLAGIVCLGERQRDLVRKYSRDISQFSKLEVVPPWDKRPLPTVARNENRFLLCYGLQQKRVALYAGNLGNAHGFEEILEAARILVETDEHWIFVFVVRGVRVEKLKAAAQGLSNVLVLDYQPLQMTADLLWSADIHLVTMLPTWNGVVVPSKLYGTFQTSSPVLYVGPDDSDTALEIKKYNAGVVLPNGSHGKEVVEKMQWLARHWKGRYFNSCTQGADRIADIITNSGFGYGRATTAHVKPCDRG